MDYRSFGLMVLLAACSSGGDDRDSFTGTNVTVQMTDGPATSSTGEATTGVTSTVPGGTTEEGGTTAGDSEGTPTSSGTDTGGSTSSTGEPDQTTGPPLPDPFTAGHVFVAGWNDHKVFEYDAALNSVSSWTHPSFDVVEGPSGMVFDHRGFLVVSTYQEFCVFSGPDEIEVCHPKIKEQRTENIIFDIFRNLYTTTSTGGTDEIHKYDQFYAHITTFNLPTGNLTGITCEPSGDLFVASQQGPVSIVYKVDRDDLQVLDQFEVAGNAEGLQYAQDDTLLVGLSGGVGIARVIPSSPSMVLDTISNPGLLWPVPVTIDQVGNRYTGDFEDGGGVAASDLYVFAPDGTVVAARQPSELHGPFGLVVAGVSLPCGAVPPG
jgi:sugar lactone lactonase YvrE